MKQILQNLKTGVTEVAQLPSPRAGAGQLLIHTTRTLVSAGTERMLVEFGKANWLDKARQQPDKLKNGYVICISHPGKIRPSQAGRPDRSATITRTGRTQERYCIRHDVRPPPFTKPEEFTGNCGKTMKSKTQTKGWEYIPAGYQCVVRSFKLFRESTNEGR